MAAWLVVSDMVFGEGEIGRERGQERTVSEEKEVGRKERDPKTKQSRGISCSNTSLAESGHRDTSFSAVRRNCLMVSEAHSLQPGERNYGHWKV